MTRLLAGSLLAAWMLLPAPLPAQTTENNEYQEITSPPSGVSPGARKPNLSQVTQQIIQQTNAFRVDHGRRKLKVNERLMRSAQEFADFMARTDKYGHTADGKQPSQRVKEQGYRYCVVAENIAWDYDSEGFSTQQLADSLMKGWRHSPPHRHNLLDRALTDIGVGVAYSSHSGRYYAVQDFGRPQSLAVHFSITNNSAQTVRYSISDHSHKLPPRYTITYTTCRPPAVALLGQDGEAIQTINPRDGSHYVVRREQNGEPQLEKTAAKEDE